MSSGNDGNGNNKKSHHHVTNAINNNSSNAATTVSKKVKSLRPKVIPLTKMMKKQACKSLAQFGMSITLIFLFMSAYWLTGGWMYIMAILYFVLLLMIILMNDLKLTVGYHFSMNFIMVYIWIIWFLMEHPSTMNIVHNYGLIESMVKSMLSLILFVLAMFIGDGYLENLVLFVAIAGIFSLPVYTISGEGGGMTISSIYSFMNMLVKSIAFILCYLLCDLHTSSIQEISSHKNIYTVNRTLWLLSVHIYFYPLSVPCYILYLYTINSNRMVIELHQGSKGHVVVTTNESSSLSMVPLQQPLPPSVPSTPKKKMKSTSSSLSPRKLEEGVPIKTFKKQDLPQLKTYPRTSSDKVQKLMDYMTGDTKK